MKDYLKLKLSNCKNCYKCIRHCPVKAIRFENNQASIIKDECILCGNCFLICPQNTKEIIDDTSAAKRMIKENRRVYASVAPSFAANYPGVTIGSMRQALMKLGFHDVQETAVGATLVKKQYEQLIRDGEMNIIISTSCHTVNLLIEKYYPEAVPYLAPVVSPMQAHCSAIKRNDPEAKTVFIGPCISKKAEADAYPGSVDCVLTFDELSRWLDDERIEFEKIPEDNDQTKARLFPTAGGILRTMDKQETGYALLAVDGIDACIDAVKEIISGNLSQKCFIEMSACKGSCIGGPAMNRSRRMPVGGYIEVVNSAGGRDFPVLMPEAEKLFKKFNSTGKMCTLPGDEEIIEVLKKMGKTSPEHELNCGTCGYDTCRDKAAAIIRGKADLMMCLPFLMEKAVSFSDNIIQNSPNGMLVLNEDFEVQRLNDAAQRMLRIVKPDDIMNKSVTRILPADDFRAVADSGKTIFEHRLYLAEYKAYLEQTIVHDEIYHMYIVILRDVSIEESERERKEHISQQTIETADKVIDKQMRAVQEIASLLGETTAEIKVALTNLKESLHSE